MIDRKLAVSKATRDFHVQQGFDPDSTWVQYNGVDTKTFRPRDDHWSNHDVTLPSDRSLTTELGIASEHQTLLFVGQIGMRKGIDVLLEVHDRFNQQHCRHLLIVGERNSQKEEAIEYERELRERSASKPVGPLARSAVTTSMFS